MSIKHLASRSSCLRRQTRCTQQLLLTTLQHRVVLPFAVTSLATVELLLMVPSFGRETFAAANSTTLKTHTAKEATATIAGMQTNVKVNAHLVLQLCAVRNSKSGAKTTVAATAEETELVLS